MGKSMWKIVEEHGPLVEALPFSENEYERRLRSLRNAMRLRGLDAFITFTPENIYYITGHDSPGYYFYEASIVTTDERPVNILRTIEATVTHWRSWSRRAFAYQDRDDPVEVTIALFDQLGVLSKNIGMESESFFVTPKTHAALKSAIGQYGGKVHDAQLIEPLRVVKSGEELEYVRRGARVAECAMRAAIDASAAGVSENYIAGAMWQAMASAGGQYAGLPPFITSGKRTSLCHATWAGRSVEPGDVLAYSLPGVVQRYVAPLFRCGTVGTPPAHVQRLADACIASLEAVAAAIRPGATSGEVHAANSRTLEKAGYSAGHRTGYSVGINYPPDWGEGAIMSLWDDDFRQLLPGMIFHIVPGVFVPGEFLIIISDTMLVTDTGCEVLTSFPRQLFTV